jgi:hypothetical protein
MAQFGSPPVQRTPGCAASSATVAFSRILDRVEIADEAWVSAEWKKRVVKVSKKLPPAKAVALTFADATRFIRVK